MRTGTSPSAPLWPVAVAARKLLPSATCRSNGPTIGTHCSTGVAVFVLSLIRPWPSLVVGRPVAVILLGAKITVTNAGVISAVLLGLCIPRAGIFFAIGSFDFTCHQRVGKN